MRPNIPKKQPNGFRNLGRYLAGLSQGQTPDRVAWSYTRNLPTDDPHVAARAMEATADTNTNCRKPAYHFSLNFSPRDAAAGRVDDATMKAASEDVIKRVGLDGYQAMVYAHRDTEHPHVHVLVNRVHPETGRVYDRHNDAKRLVQCVREVARERGLDAPRERSRSHERDPLGPEQPGHRRPNDPAATQPQPMTKDDARAIRDELRDVFTRSSSWDDLASRLNERGYHLAPKGQGLIVSDGAAYAKLSDMGKNVRLRALEQKFDESFESYTRRAAQQIARANDPTGTRRSGGDAVDDADHSDRAYHQARSLAQSYDATRRTLDETQRRQDRLDARYKHHRQRHDKREEKLLDRLGRIFSDAKEAHRTWNQLETKHGTHKADAFIRENPRILESPRHNSFKWTPADERYRKSLDRLIRERDAWRGERRRLRALSKQIEQTRSELARARQTYVHLRRVAGSRDVVRNMVLARLKARAAALDRVTDRMIRESKIADRRKAALRKAVAKHQQRKRQMRREHERERERKPRGRSRF